ncbi:polyA polymerase [Nitzschia inconspicua]|uniref:PolyA polymerase n=1 Tax=Nitzschia inconspicua TaxID=303405 RepID=A0A9K3Q640_9STRA|nr:polyA polymerase [Nitzschia inconspicua]
MSTRLLLLSLLPLTSAFQRPSTIFSERYDCPQLYLYHQRRRRRRNNSSPTSRLCLKESTNPDDSSSSESGQHCDKVAPYQRSKRPFGTYSARYLEDNGLAITTDKEGFVTAKPAHEVVDWNNDNDDHDDRPVNLDATLYKVPGDGDPPPETYFQRRKDEEILIASNNLDNEEDFLDVTTEDFDDFDYTFLKDLDTTQSTVLKGEPVVPASSSSQLTPNIIPDDQPTSLPDGSSTSKNRNLSRPKLKEQPVQLKPLTGFNVVLTHCTADFDSLASAVGLAKLWSSETIESQDADVPEVSASSDDRKDRPKKAFDSSDSQNFPTFVVLPRGAHPSVQRFLALHKHLFPIRSLKSLPHDLSKLNRLALVDAQRRDRIGPAEHLLEHAKRVIVVDHHVDMESDIHEATDYVVDKVGSVSTLIVERLMKQQQRQQQLCKIDCDLSPFTLTEAEATLLALGIHADTGSLCFDSTTPRDATALAWVMGQGASQVAIAEHAQSSLSREQQNVLTQALIKTNSTVAHGVTISTVLLTADGFIQGLAAVTQDALELSSSDVYLLGLVYEPKAGGQRRKKKNEPGERIKSRLLMGGPIQENDSPMGLFSSPQHNGEKQTNIRLSDGRTELEIEEPQLKRLRAAFDRKDLDGSGCLNKKELSAALAAAGIVATQVTIDGLMETMDTNQDGRIDFEEFVTFARDVQLSIEKRIDNQTSIDGNENAIKSIASPQSTLIIIGRAKPGVNLKAVKLGKMLEKYGGGGHAKAASATVRLNDEAEAAGILSGLVDELIETSLQAQPTVGAFMTSPVLSVKPDMTEKQVEDLFTRYDVRALPVIDENNDVIGLVTYKEVAAAKQRMWNKEQKRMREDGNKKKKDNVDGESDTNEKIQKNMSENRKRNGSTVKAWMKQHITTVEASQTMAEVEAILLGNDVGCIPVVQDGTKQLVGMVTRTDLLRQHRYYPSLHYNNKGMSDSIAARKPIIALRKRLKQFDLDE